jgi:hypothetical protein
MERPAGQSSTVSPARARRVGRTVCPHFRHRLMAAGPALQFEARFSLALLLLVAFGE